MAWNFRKRIKIIPGVYLNLSKSGISTSVGVKGANMTFASSGSYLNTSVPFLGIYNRQKLTNSNPSSQHQFYNDTLAIDQTDNIFSGDIEEITSQDMQGVKEAILLAHQQKEELKHDLLQIKSALRISKLKHALSYILLYGLIKKAIPASLKIDMEAQKEAIKQTEEQIGNAYVKLQIEFDPEIQEKYDRLLEAFRKLTTSYKIWDVTSAHFQDRIAARSSANTIVNKRDVRFTLKSLPNVKSDYEALHFQNANGADLYFYPSFIVMFADATNFAIIGFDEINIQCSPVRFTETGDVPPDSKIIDRTWAKVNKNGTPDRRFKGNYQIPIVRYGEMRLWTTTGLNEEYEFSNYEFTEEFEQTFKEYQATLKRIKHLGE